MRRTKIVATVGPASGSTEGVRALVAAGANVIRINCSHLSTEEMRAQFVHVRESAPDVAILVDVQGPKMRYTGPERTITEGETLVLGTDILGFDTGVRSSDALGLRVGHRVLLDDGRLECRITGLEGSDVALTVVRGGLLRTKKGVNLPDTEVLGGVLSSKDVDDIAVARELGAEIIAVSFVQHPDDVVRVRELAGPEPLIFSKIERPQAIDRLDDICRVSDGVMAARGDLGVELPYEELPSLQRRIALTALKMGVISICATEMVESMTTSTRPTRAEVADVSAAVRDGFDAVMLSGETAVGHNPPLAVSSMVRIAEVAERNLQMPNWFADENPETAAVTAAAAALAKRTNADWIVALTYTGYSARLLAACRPSCPIIAVTPDDSAARRLNVVRGVYPVIGERNPDVTRSIEQALEVSRTSGMIMSGNKVVVCVSRLSARSDADTILLHNER